MTLCDLVRPDAILSTGLLIEQEHLLLFAAGEPRYWTPRGNRVLIPIIGIGGKTEPGEHPADAAKREALEEAGLAVELLDSPAARYCVGDHPLHHRLSGRPAAAPFPGLAKKPGTSHGRRIGQEDMRLHVTAVYRAVPLGPAYPAGETPALISLPRSLLPAAIRGVSLRALRQAGGEVVARVQLPPRPVFYAFGSALYLARLALAARE